MIQHIKKLSIVSSLGLSLTSHGAVIGYWDFNDGFDVPDETVEIVHTASQGNGTFYQQRAETDGNGKGGIAYTNTDEGIVAAEGRAIAWDDIGKSGNNDAQFFVVLDTTGYENINISFDVRGNVDAGIVSYDLEYATAGIETVTQTQAQVDAGDEDFVGTFVDFLNSLSTGILGNEDVVVNTEDFEKESIDLSSVTDLNNQSNLVLRFDDWAENDELTIDNFLVTGTLIAVPEPSSIALLGLGSIAFIMRRKRV